ncbi:MAG: RNA polymerase sigma factor [Actinomycetota bacterium]
MAVAQSTVGLDRLRDAEAKQRDLRSDKTLVRAAKAGQAEAASALVERHYPRVYSFVSYQTVGRGTAEDLTQEVFARALGAIQNFNGRYQFQPWLLRIAKNLVIDEARKDKHRATPSDPEDLVQMETPAPDADQVWNAMSQQLAGSTVRNALAQLPPRQRTALVLREIEEMSYADIAQILGTNVRGVEGTLRRAKARFRLAATNAEADESLEPTCRRALRLVALNGRTPGPEADAHLQSCSACRNKSTAVLSADGLFAALPALGLRGFDWGGQVAAMLPQATAGAKLAGIGAKISGIFSSGGSSIAPLAPVLQIAGAAVVAAGLTAGSAVGYGNASRDATPPSFSAGGYVPVFALQQTPQSAVADAPSEVSPPQIQSGGPLVSLPAGPVIQAPELVGSVIGLLGAHLPPGLDIRQLPIEGQVELLDELSPDALSEIAKVLDVDATGDKAELLSAIKQALTEDPSLLTKTPVPSPGGVTTDTTTVPSTTNAATSAGGATSGEGASTGA